jgi:hypothetical protein
MAVNLSGEGKRESAVVEAVAGREKAAEGDEAAADSEVALEVDVEEVPLEIPRPAATGFPAPTGFQAFLQHANLHNLLQIESLSRTTGVFLVASQGRRGYLHLANGDLIHAEVGALTGEAAAAQILSWDDGEFKSCSRPLTSTPTIQGSLQALLLRLARDTDEAAALSERRPPVTSALPAVEEDKPTEPHLPAPQFRAFDAAAGSSGAASEGPARPSSAPPGPPRPSRMPPPLPPRADREPAPRDFMSRETAVAEVLISPSGDLVQGRGAGPDEFSARVAYAARLADLIGRAIRSGTPRALELKGKGTQTMIQWQPDGTLSATLELVQSPKMR